MQELGTLSFQLTPVTRNAVSPGLGYFPGVASGSSHPLGFEDPTPSEEKCRLLLKAALPRHSCCTLALEPPPRKKSPHALDDGRTTDVRREIYTEARKRQKNRPNFHEHSQGLHCRSHQEEAWQKEPGHYIRGSHFIHVIPSK